MLIQFAENRTKNRNNNSILSFMFQLIINCTKRITVEFRPLRSNLNFALPCGDSILEKFCDVILLNSDRSIIPEKVIETIDSPKHQD